MKARVLNLLENRYRLRKLLSNHKNEPVSVSDRVAPFVRSVMEILDEYYMDPEFNVTELSNKLYMDRSHLLRKLKNSLDLTPSEFIKNTV